MHPLLALSLLMPALAHQPPATPAPRTRPIQAATATAAGLDPNETICRRYRESGSRIAIRRVCMTREEWTAFNRELRQNVDRAQLTRVMSK
jgi:hypothetical protein